MYKIYALQENDYHRVGYRIIEFVEGVQKAYDIEKNVGEICKMDCCTLDGKLQVKSIEGLWLTEDEIKGVRAEDISNDMSKVNSLMRKYRKSRYDW